MAIVPKVDYKELERLYVTEGLTYRELSRRYPVSHTVIAAKGRRDDWPGKRIAYQASLSRRAYENMAAAAGSEVAEIQKESILVARAYIRKFAQDLGNNKVSTNARDTVEFMRMLAGELNPEKGEGLRDAPYVIEGKASPIAGADADLLRRVVEMARERVAAPGVLGTGPLVEPPEPRPN